MPIQLTTPFNVGEADVTSPFQSVKIQVTEILPDVRRINFVTRLGNDGENGFQYGLALEGVTVKRFSVADEEYDAMISAKSAGANEVYYDKVGALLYQWLLDKGYFVGSIS